MTAVIFGRYVSAMAHHVITFLDALGPNQADLLGFSLGGFVARQVVFERPDLVRRLILAGTGPQGGEGMQKRVCGARGLFS
jgi:pimeloyl-ACP methyl ester carboxylesterase